MKDTNKILCIIIAIIIIIGAIVCKTKGFNIELTYSNRDKINLSSNSELDSDKVEEIAKEILTDRKVKVQELERFGNAVEVIAESISDEEKTNLINKINEECNSNISNDDTEITSISNTKIRDILKPYILPAVITFAAVLLYFIIMYHKLGLRTILLKGIFIPIISELVYYSLIAIVRIPFGRITNSIAIGIYVVAIGALAVKFQNEKEKLPKNNDKKEND